MKTTKPIKIKLRWHDRDTDNLVRRVNQETAEEGDEEELVEILQRRPRKCDNEQQEEGSDQEQDSTPKTRSTVVEPRMEEESLRRLEAVTMVQQEPVTESQTSPGLQE